MKSTQSKELRAMKKSKIGVAKSAATKKSRSKGSFIRSFIDFVGFAFWLGCTGFAGYYVGRSPSNICPESTGEGSSLSSSSNSGATSKLPPCVYDKSGAGLALGALNRKDGFTYAELSRMWQCSQSQFNFTQANQRIYPKEGNMDKTKWKTVLSVEPKAFFDKYLTQYPSDTRAVQPVVIFSHKPLKNFEELSDICKVLDIAIVPDKPGMCVAVTETYHDVASYHMLHADKQADGSFALTNNHIKERILPDEGNYEAARSLLIDFFDHVESVSKIVKGCPRFSKGKVSIGVLIESLDELLLFENSLASADRKRISTNKFCLFTTSAEVSEKLNTLKGIGGVPKSIFLSELADVGKNALTSIPSDFRTSFLQAWLAFAVSNANNRMLWQSPGTIWFEKPDNIVSSMTESETLFAFKGRKDPRASPFFVSMDFFTVTGNERAVHLMHELMLHFDLAFAWNSFDSLAAYRLSENNSRYGTTTLLFPPYKVLHTDLLGSNAEKIRHAVAAKDHPMAVVFPREGRTAAVTKDLLIDSNLWLLPK